MAWVRLGVTTQQRIGATLTVSTTRSSPVLRIMYESGESKYTASTQVSNCTKPGAPRPLAGVHGLSLGF